MKAKRHRRHTVKRGITKQKHVRRNPITAPVPLMATASKIPTYEKSDVTKVAIIQPASFGDNINSTLMFKPIKNHFEKCLLDIHTSTKYGNIFINNPHIDNIIYHTANNKRDALHLGCTLPKILADKGYDHILLPHPMYNPGMWNSCQHPEWGENLIFAWVHALERLKIEYDVPLETVLCLTEEEIRKVHTLIEHVPQFKTRRNILFEIHGESGQTFWNERWTLDVGRHLLDGKTNLFFSHFTQREDILKLRDEHRGYVHWVGKLTIRECAELFNHCDAFFSVSSGLSNACGTNWCKNDIKWFEVVNSVACSSAAIRKEGKVFWHSQNIEQFINMLKKQLPSK